MFNTRLFGSSLNEATNSYKFFWLQALLSVIEREPQFAIPIRAVVAEMLVAAWHPVTLYRLSLGMQDMLQHGVWKLQRASGIGSSASITEVRQAVTDISIEVVVPELDRYVPYRFLAPWFENDLAHLIHGDVGS